MRKHAPLDALFPRVRQAVLSALLLRPDRRWYLSDLAAYLGAPPSSLQRDLAALSGAGILCVRRDGNRVYYQADPSCPILPELQGLLTKTVGVTSVLRETLAPFTDAIDAAFVYGSVARGDYGPDSDVDLMVVGTAQLAKLAPALRAAEQRLGRPINATVYTKRELADKLLAGNHFVAAALQGDKLPLQGDMDDLVGTARGAAGSAAR